MTDEFFLNNEKTRKDTKFILPLSQNSIFVLIKTLQQAAMAARKKEKGTLRHYKGLLRWGASLLKGSFPGLYLLGYVIRPTA